jgi:uncharacterized protein
MKKRLWFFAGGSLALFAFVFGVVSLLGTYQATHFAGRSPGRLWQLVPGILRPLARPALKEKPSVPFESVRIASGEYELAGWHLRAPAANGTFILFHGYGGTRSEVVPHAEYLVSAGYNALLVDFRAHGESTGDTSTIGYREADDVKAAFDWVRSLQPGARIGLFGISMGAAAVLTAMDRHELPATLIVLECPYGDMLSAVEGRLRMDGLPPWPLTRGFAFWSERLFGLPASAHRPADYARRVTCPTLLFWGDNDRRVTRAETDAIFANLAGPKQLVVLPGGRHERALPRFAKEWRAAFEPFAAANGFPARSP